MARFGDGVKGVETMDEFVTALRNMRYNSATSSYDDNLPKQCDSVLRRCDQSWLCSEFTILGAPYRYGGIRCVVRAVRDRRYPSHYRMGTLGQSVRIRRFTAAGVESAAAMRDTPTSHAVRISAYRGGLLYAFTLDGKSRNKSRDDAVFWAAVRWCSLRPLP